MRRRRGVAALVAAGLAGIALVAAGCTAGRTAASTRPPAAAAGQGAAANTSRVYPPGQRAVPGPVTGQLLDGGRYDLAAARGPALGAVFALSWTPCLSPTLSVVLGLAAVQGSAGRGVILAAAYSLGMGLPFIGFAAGFGRLLRATRLIRRHSVWVTRLGGVLLVAVGLALVSGVWGEFLNWLRATVGPGQIGI